MSAHTDHGVFRLFEADVTLEFAALLVALFLAGCRGSRHFLTKHWTARLAPLKDDETPLETSLDIKGQRIDTSS